MNTVRLLGTPSGRRRVLRELCWEVLTPYPRAGGLFWPGCWLARSVVVVEVNG